MIEAFKALANRWRCGEDDSNKSALGELEEVIAMVESSKGEADRQVVLSKYPDAFCARNPGEPWQVMRVNPYVALSRKHDSADEAWADAANTVQAAEKLQGAIA